MYACVFWNSLKQFTKDSVTSISLPECPGNTFRKDKIQEDTYASLVLNMQTITFTSHHTPGLT